MFDTVEIRCEKHKKNYKIPFIPDSVASETVIKLPCGCKKKITLPKKKEDSMREICHICHESVNDWELEWIEIPEIGKLKICGECLEKVQDFIGTLLYGKREKKIK